MKCRTVDLTKCRFALCLIGRVKYCALRAPSAKYDFEFSEIPLGQLKAAIDEKRQKLATQKKNRLPSGQRQALCPFVALADIITTWVIYLSLHTVITRYRTFALPLFQSL